MVLIILDVLSCDVSMSACVRTPESQISLKFTSQPTPSDTSSVYHQYTGLDMGPFQVHSSHLGFHVWALSATVALATRNQGSG